MADLEALFKAVDQLSPEEVAQLRDYIDQHRSVVKWWAVPPNNLAKIDQVMRPVQQDASQMTEAEVNALLEETLDEVRHERRRE